MTHLAGECFTVCARNSKYILGPNSDKVFNINPFSIAIVILFWIFKSSSSITAVGQFKSSACLVIKNVGVSEMPTFTHECSHHLDSSSHHDSPHLDCARARLLWKISLALELTQRWACVVLRFLYSFILQLKIKYVHTTVLLCSSNAPCESVLSLTVIKIIL